MNMATTSLEGLIFGISMGIHCTCSCIAILLPIIIVNGENTPNSLRIVVQFLVGRIAAYVIWVTLLITLKEHLLLGIGRTLISATLLVSAVFVIFYGLKVNFPELFGYSNSWPILQSVLKRFPIKIPFLAGFAIGTNPCPPLLAAFTYALAIGNITASFAFLCCFLIGTTIFTLPFSFVGIIGKFPRIKDMAQAAIILSGLWFASKGIAIIIWG